MREAYHAQLAAIDDQLVEMTRLVGSAMSRATTALLDADLPLAEAVITRDQVVDKLRDGLDERAIVTSLRISADVERMGDLAVHVAKAARMRHPRRTVPTELSATMLEMGQVAQRIVAKAGSVIASRGVKQALE